MTALLNPDLNDKELMKCTHVRGGGFHLRHQRLNKLKNFILHITVFKISARVVT
jgi:hypothetical protein